MKTASSPAPSSVSTGIPSPLLSQRRRSNPGKLAGFLVAAVALAIGGYYGIRHLQFALRHEETDDAQVEGDISPVLPRVSGYVTRILVEDNQHVVAAQPLVEIDSRELDLKISEMEAAAQSAQAARENALALLGNARAAADVARANIDVAAVTQEKTAADLARDRKLFQTGAITDRDMTDSQAAADIAQTRLEAIRRQAEAAETQVAVAQSAINSAEALIQQRQADLDYAKLERSYDTVTAPITGDISHKSIEPGQYVQAGQTLLSIASESNVWVVANYKETQVGRMRIGQEVEIKADAYRGYRFRGRVQSFSGATGARFALLPPDNASGNFVKVTQRLPVKIVLTSPPDPEHPLRPGMSVDTAVKIRD